MEGFRTLADRTTTRVVILQSIPRIRQRTVHPYLLRTRGNPISAQDDRSRCSNVTRITPRHAMRVAREA